MRIESSTYERREEKAESQKKREETEAQEHLLQGQRLLALGDYEGALKENQRVLSLSGNRPPGDHALFNLGLIYVHFGNPKKDYGQAFTFFNKLLRDHPKSPLTEQAKIWKAVLQEFEKLTQTIAKLNQVIEDSKKVDIEIEEMKRQKGK
ncbi:MAG: tol-pal system YbgF family protein [Thermodesulfobacteriota bacterium]